MPHSPKGALRRAFVVLFLALMVPAAFAGCDYFCYHPSQDIADCYQLLGGRARGGLADCESVDFCYYYADGTPAYCSASCAGSQCYNV